MNGTGAVEPIHITDVSDPRIDRFRNVRERDLRGQSGDFIAESESVVRRLLSRRGALRALLLTPQRFEALADALSAARFPGDVFVAGLDVMCAISGFHIHRGVLGLGDRTIVEGITVEALADRARRTGSGVLIVADHLTHIDNMGSMFRVAAGFGAIGVLLSPGCCDPLYRKAIRVSMGHVLAVPFAVSDHLAADLRKLRDELGGIIVAAESGIGGMPPWSADFTRPFVICVFGSESHGISGEILDLADQIVEIPMCADIPSINVAHAASVVMYEIARQSSGLR